MARRRSSRSLSSVVSTTPEAFSDARDSIAPFTYRPGAIYPSLAPLPRPNLTYRRWIEDQASLLSYAPRLASLSTVHRTAPRTHGAWERWARTRVSLAPRGISVGFPTHRLNLGARTTICVRRRIRSQVLHALGVAGRRGIGRGGVRRTVHSSWSC